MPGPDPSTEDEDENRYTLDKTVTVRYADGTTGVNYLDLYKAGCFVLEAKQGADAPAGPAPLSAEKSAGKRRSRHGAAGHAGVG